jgi:hypothetical protein
MGLLDDAIREHLELKRRRGADPGEIEREEVEALGPVRRGDVELDEDDDERELGPDADDEPPGLEDPGAAYDDEPPVATTPPPMPAPPASPIDHPVPAEPPQTHDAPFAEDEADSATPPHGDPWVQQPTREFSADELEEALSDHHDAPPGGAAPAADPDVVPADDGESDDVLEETPDFLQETPEHDRLWFEQKPPKDFDF